MKYIRKLISVFLALCITVSCMTGLTMTVSAYDDPLIVVALGDSYSSGEGIEPFYGQDGTAAQKVADDDWLAHRSTKAWGGMLTLDGVTGTMAQHRNDNWYFAAASGAKTQHINSSLTKTYNYGGLTGSKALDPQINVFADHNLTGKVDYVTLTIGGNDIGFSDIMTTAFVEELFSQMPMSKMLLGTAFPEISAGTKTLSGLLTSARGQFGSIKTKLKTVYSQIGTAAGSQAVIIVAGYPTLLSEKNYAADNDSAVAFTASINYLGSPISINFPAKKAHEINEAVKDFNAVIKAAVDECAADGMNIRFVDVTNKFSGKEAYSDGELINGIMLKADGDQNIDVGQFISAYSFHPNASGAIQYAAAVQAEIDKLENPFTVTFDSTGGTAVASQKVVDGEKAVEPDAPTREGNTFAGWYDNEDCTGDPFSFTNTAITENKTLYAKWTHTHDFTYSADGATITATCSADGCDLTEHKATLTINAPENLTYDGYAQPATITGDTDILGTPEIKYTGGTSVFNGAPAGVGTYTASITVGGVTASVGYTIVPRPVTVTQPVVVSKVYDGTTEFFKTIQLDSTNSDLAGNEKVEVQIIGYFEDPDIGNDKAVTVTNLNIMSPVYVLANLSLIGEIVEYQIMRITIKAKDQKIVFGGSISTDISTDKTLVEITSGSLAGGHTLDSITLSDGGMYGIGSANHITPSAAVIKDAQGNDVTAHYDITYEQGTLTVTKATAKVTTAPTAKTLTYNGEPQELVTAGSSLHGTVVYYPCFLVGDIIIPPSNAEYSATIPTATNAGTYTVFYKVISSSPDVYDDSDVYGLEVTIARAPATVKADNKSKEAGDNDPALTATVTGLFGSDTVSYTLSRSEGNDAGIYTITPSGDAEQGNYDVTFETGTLTITEPPVAVTKISINNQYVFLEMGNTLTLNAKITPDNATDKTITWTSENTAVATVDEKGAVKPVSVGIVTITAAVGGKSAKCVVIVIKNRYIDPTPAIPFPTTGSVFTPAASVTSTTTDTTAAASNTTTTTSDTDVQNNKIENIVTATVSQSTVTLKWDRVKGAESYTIYVKENGEWKKLKTTTKNTLKVTKLTNGKTYEFLIRYKVDGKLSAIEDSYKVSAKAYYKPTVKLTAKKGSITIGWKSVPGAAKYKVYKYVNGMLRLVTDTTKHTVRITGTKAGKEYSYAVKAYVDGKWTKVYTSDIVTVTAK